MKAALPLRGDKRRLGRDALLLRGKFYAGTEGTQNQRRPTIGRQVWPEIQARVLTLPRWTIRLSRRFQLREKLSLETVIEGFNIFNRANLQLPNDVFGPGLIPVSCFGRATGAADSRQQQFGLRLSFRR